MLLTVNLTPAQMARHLSETFGYSVSASAVVKYDNEILMKTHISSDGAASRRAYPMSDVGLFNGIIVMRALGFSLETIRNIFAMDLHDKSAEKECADFLAGVLDKVERQRKGLDLFAELLPLLKERQPFGRMKSSPFKPVPAEQLKQREKDRIAFEKKESKGKA